MSDTRNQFEAWAKGKFSIGFRYEDSQLLNHVDGEYERLEVDYAWQGWQAAQPAAPVAPDLHADIMNLPCNIPYCLADSKEIGAAYKMGYRDARHAAAELVAAQLAAPVAPVLTDLDLSIEGDSQAFEAQLGREPTRVADKSYPWGWRYSSLLVQQQFQAFIKAAPQGAAPQGAGHD